jgi:hypothetical protein
MAKAATLPTANTKTLIALQELATHPTTFGLATGIANGVLASVRNLSVSPRAAVVTALVIAGGEAALAAEVPKEKRRTLPEIAGYSAIGTVLGLWLFVSNKGEPSLIQRLAPSRGFAAKETVSV